MQFTQLAKIRAANLLYIFFIHNAHSTKVTTLDNMTTPVERMRRWTVHILNQSSSFRESLRKQCKNNDDAERIRAFLIKKFTAVVQCSQELRSATQMYPPLSFVQIMRLLMDAYLVILPVVLVNEMYIAADPPLSIQIVPVIACFLVTLLYNGLMKLVSIIRMV